MNVLEKILEEVEERRGFRETLVKYEKKNGTIVDVERNRCASEELDIVERIVRSHMGEIENDGWTPVSERLPEVNLKYDDDFCTKYESENVLAQTKKGQYFSAYCDKIERKQSDWKDKIEWFTHGTGGRKMKVVSKVIAWRPLPESYKGE